jgi:hypothetical protein
MELRARRARPSLPRGSRGSPKARRAQRHAECAICLRRADAPSLAAPPAEATGRTERLGGRLVPSTSRSGSHGKPGVRSSSRSVAPAVREEQPGTDGRDCCSVAHGAVRRRRRRAAAARPEREPRSQRSRQAWPLHCRASGSLDRADRDPLRLPLAQAELQCSNRAPPSVWKSPVGGFSSKAHTSALARSLTATLQAPGQIGRGVVGEGGKVTLVPAPGWVWCCEGGSGASPAF